MAGSVDQLGPDIARIMGNIGTSVERGRVGTVGKAALGAKKVHESSIRAIVGDMHMSGVGKSGSRVGVRYDMRTSAGGASAVIKATGPLHLIERNTAGRVIRSRHGGRGRPRRGFIGPVGTSGGQRAVLNIPGIGYRRSARHPGTRGQHPWEKGRKRSEPVIRKVMRTTVFDIVKGAARP